MLTEVMLVLISMIALWLGARLTVDNASRIAKSMGISEVIIGLTVVAFGTSAPEFAVSIGAALKGYSSISVANIVGSNIFNLGFILGGIAVITHIKTTREMVYRDCMFLAITTLLLSFFLYDLELSQIEGAFLFLLLFLYLCYLLKKRKAEVRGLEEVENDEESSAGDGSDDSIAQITGSAALLICGLSAVITGSHFLVESARTLARAAGISEWIVGVTIVAAGTSAPEFVTSLVAALKGHHEISAGTLIGSDIFNCVGVLGLAGMIRPLIVVPHARVSVCMLSLMVFLILVFMRTGWKLSRAEGAFLLSIAIIRWIFDLT